MAGGAVVLEAEVLAALEGRDADPEAAGRDLADVLAGVLRVLARGDQRLVLRPQLDERSLAASSEALSFSTATVARTSALACAALSLRVLVAVTRPSVR
jgi:hypothetical protein